MISCDEKVERKYVGRDTEKIGLKLMFLGLGGEEIGYCLGMWVNEVSIP